MRNSGNKRLPPKMITGSDLSRLQMNQNELMLHKLKNITLKSKAVELLKCKKNEVRSNSTI